MTEGELRAIREKQKLLFEEFEIAHRLTYKRGREIIRLWNELELRAGGTHDFMGQPFNRK